MTVFCEIYEALQKLLHVACKHVSFPNGVGLLDCWTVVQAESKKIPKVDKTKFDRTEARKDKESAGLLGETDQTSDQFLPKIR